MKKVFRLFISSTFDDFKLERAVLQRFVFPEIKKFLNEKGMSFKLYSNRLKMGSTD